MLGREVRGMGLFKCRSDGEVGIIWTKGARQL